MQQQQEAKRPWAVACRVLLSFAPCFLFPPPLTPVTHLVLWGRGLLLVASARSLSFYVFRTTSDMSRVFCSHCGNKTLKKVSVTVSDDGTLHMHFSRNPKVLNPRGLRVSGLSPAPPAAGPAVGKPRPLKHEDPNEQRGPRKPQHFSVPVIL